MKERIRSEHADWIKIRPDSLVSSILPVPPYAQGFFDLLSPFGKECYSPLNSVFLVQFTGLKSINLRTSWLIRDGEIPLHYFFSVYPEPTGVKSKIYVEKSLAGLVPEAWRPKAGTYNLVSEPPTKPIEKCMIFGLGSAAFLSSAELEAQLQALDCESLRKLGKELYFPFRWTSSGDDEMYPFRCVSLLRSHLGENIRAVNWGEVMLRASFDRYLFLDLSSHRYCADAYPAHLLLSRGAFFKPRTQKKPDRYIALSPYHGLEVMEKIGRNIGVEASTNFASKFPWQEWFQPWSQMN